MGSQTVGAKCRANPHLQPLVSSLAFPCLLPSALASPHPLQPCLFPDWSNVPGRIGASTIIEMLGKIQFLVTQKAHTMVRLVSMTTLKGLLFRSSGSRVGDAGSRGQTIQVPEV